MTRRHVAPASLFISLALLGCNEDPAGNESPSSETSTPTETETTADNDESESETGDEGCPTNTSAELAACVERDLYLADLEFIAQPRDPGSAHWQAVQDLCFDRFTEYGFETERQDYGLGVNVVGRKLGTETPDEQILIAAHYDHIPGCNGADDNATGTAATLEAARVLSLRDYPRTLVVACWDQEELGLIGAKAYSDAAATANQQILFNYNYEMLGYFDAAPERRRCRPGSICCSPTSTPSSRAGASPATGSR